MQNNLLALATVNYKAKTPVLNYFLTADIETSDNRTPDKMPSLCWSYQQGLCMYDYEHDILIDYVETRNVLTFCKNLLDISKEVYNFNNKAVIYCFFHNLSFDMSYLRQVLIDTFKLFYGPIFNKNELFLSTGNYLFMRLNNIEFRCSYNLSNTSLYEFTKDMDVKHRKLLGANDYGTHYSDEQLSQDFYDYQRNDCIGLAEAITKLGHKENYKLALLPYTYTSFNRKAMAKSFRKTANGIKVNQEEIRTFERCKPTMGEYNLLKVARHGGFVMAMPNYIGKDIIDDMLGNDYRSMYPAAMLFFDYPISKGKRIILNRMTKKERLATFEKAIEGLALARIILKRPRLKKDKYIPFLQLNHSTKAYMIPEEEVVMYNNRVVNITSKILVDTTVTSPDARILLQQYDFDDIDIAELYTYEAGPLSPIITNKALELFEEKTKAKINYKNADKLHKPEANRKLIQAKQKLNSLAGILQENPIKNQYYIDDDGRLVGHNCFLDDVLGDPADVYIRSIDALEKHYTAYKNGKCFSYTDGVFLLAYARELLFKAFDTIGQKYVIYADTDSAYFLKNHVSLAKLNAFNASLVDLARKRGAYCIVDGQYYYMGEFVVDHDNITRFRAMASKRYIFTDGKKIYATLSGIKAGVGLHEEYDENGIPQAVYTYTRAMELCDIPYDSPRQPTAKDIEKGFDNFKNGFTFKICGGSYNKKLYHTPEIIDINGHQELVAGGICILQAERTMCDAASYMKLEDTDIATRAWSLDTLMTVKPTLNKVLK